MRWQKNQTKEGIDPPLCDWEFIAFLVWNAFDENLTI